MQPDEHPIGHEPLAADPPRPHRGASRVRSHATSLIRKVPTAVAALLTVLARWALRVALPLAGAAALLHSFPYRATVQGVPLLVHGTLLTRPGLSADTTVGSWVFPELSGLPIGVHVQPVNVDVLQLTQAAAGNRTEYAARFQADALDQLPRILTWLLAEVLLGIVVGLLAAAAVNMSLRYLRGRPRRPDELAVRVRQLGAAVAVVLVVGVYGWVTYNPDWVRQSRLTGTLAAAQLFPDQLRNYYTQESKVFDVLGSVVGLQAALQGQIDDDQAPATALEIMFISDMHLAANYPLVKAYADSYNVDLIVNTGDESEFGTAMELTPTYLDALRAVTATTPMLWVAGNHDSPAVVAVMRSIPGVTVLGTKVSARNGYEVSAGMVRAYGLTIVGLSDPRTYGGPGAYGSDDTSATLPLQRSVVDEALTPLTAGDDEKDALVIDIFATHGPAGAAEARKQLGDRIRQTNVGHRHEQNDPADIQSDSGIDLVEGSTGAGGLDNIVRGSERPPIAFSIESVSADCQFNRVVRFQIRSAQPDRVSTAEAADPRSYGSDVAATTSYLRPQDIDEDRTCGVPLGIDDEEPLRR